MRLDFGHRDREALLKGYLPYLVGTLAGLLLALTISGLLTLQGTPQLMLFALLPAIGGAIAERVSERRSGKF
ncbi:hypothetical protein EEQ99_24395 [Rhizobium anhuiense]|jgi:hypothetical protein|uniref:Uncharacterized protein n=1 Tax=Rhizobium anhuiense TaxID=1184720 RepID=A0A432NGE9_9HYPH|nr:hypothetical protein EEQ99_24395 [Rhizobium anhuiense]